MRMHTPTRPGIHMHGRTRKHAHTDQYVILIAFPQQQWLRERASMLRYTYITDIFLFLSFFLPLCPFIFFFFHIHIRGVTLNHDTRICSSLRLHMPYNERALELNIKMPILTELNILSQYRLSTRMQSECLYSTEHYTLTVPCFQY